MFIMERLIFLHWTFDKEVFFRISTLRFLENINLRKGQGKSPPAAGEFVMGENNPGFL